ncbi:MAG: ribonuclease H family protein [Clostridiales bacterium]|jgi:ribonuclease HI|nr:ribonuclease H family protein [Clostridiales bacterium]
MTKKFYAVKQGRKAGVFPTWNECKTQIHGYSGAIYKSFATEKDAWDFLLASPAEIHIQNEAIDKAIAFVDGSYSHESRSFSCGVIFIYNDEIKEFCERYNDTALAEMRNVAGEIKGAELAMKYCLEQGIPHLEIYYDYEGIERWCSGAWKAAKPGTKAYKSFYDSLGGKLTVNFKKVTAHSNNRYNDEADRLAKKALGLSPRR